MSDFPTVLTEAEDNVTDVLAKHVNNLEAKVGIDDSAVVTSLDYASKLGWISDSEAWTYGSSVAITIPEGTAGKFQKGDRIKFTQNSTVKYFYIITVAATSLGVIGNGAVVVENTETYPITAKFHSHCASPKDFPDYFTYTPTYNSQGGAFTNPPSTQHAKFRIVGSWCRMNGLFTYDANSGGTGDTYMTLPVVPATNYSAGYGSKVYNGERALQVFAYNSGHLYICLYDGTTCIANGQQMVVGAEYSF
jgi:hypothetical protein